jgi:sialidase-1
MTSLFVLLAALLCCAALAEPLLSPATDYGRSVVTHFGTVNAPLFWLESRCRISDPAAEIVRDYYQCGSCKSENTFGKKDLFLDPNYDFLPIFTEGQTIVFRRFAAVTERYMTVSTPLWGTMTPKLRPANTRILTSTAEIAAAVAAGLPLIGQVEVRDAESGRSAVIEFPIKTMNVLPDRKGWQVDTGPVLLPDLKAPPEKWSETLRLAYIAYNTDGWADFVIEAPTAVGDGAARVHHYSLIAHFATRNQVLAMDIGAETAPTTPEVIQVDGVTKIGLLPPGLGNPRNSEGAFIRLKDGRVLLIYSRFTSGGGDDSEAALASRMSSDGGRTWAAADVTVVPNEGKQNVMSASLLRLQSGEIALFYLRKNGWDDCRAYMRISRDEARTWSEATLCNPPQGYFVVNNDRVIQLKSGRIVIPAARHATPGSKFLPGVAMCFLSDDHGRTWRQSKSELPGPPGCGSGLQEPGIIELKDGRLMMLCRTDQGCQYRSWSSDGGETWSPAETTDILSPCGPATFKRIPSTGDILMVWNDHSGNPALGQKRTPLVAAVSQDEGKTWGRRKVLESDPDGWFCYTAMDFVDDRVLLAYCATGKSQPGLSRTQITLFDVKWLYE